MTWQMIHLNDIPPSPWRNGGGVTRELIAWPGADNWRWRMSVAEVAQSGPFSKFEGVQRWFAVLTGAGVRLTMGAQGGEQAHTQELTQTSAPFCFDGEQPVDCTLTDGATQDFNLMLRAGQAKARMARVNGEFSSLLQTPKIIAVYAITTVASLHFENQVLTLQPGTLVWRPCPAGSKFLVKADNALWMEIDA